MKWVGFILAGWAAVFALSSWLALRPASDWITAESAVIADAKAGECPAIAIDRQIHKAFAGRWIFTLLKRADGGFGTFRVFHGNADFQPGLTLPEQFNIGWFMDCEFMQPGAYKASMLWIIDPPSGPDVEVRLVSNEFEVMP